MSDDEEEEKEVDPVMLLWPDFFPMAAADMPTLRLKDVITNLETKTLAVLSIDALLPTGEQCAPVLQTILYLLQPSITTLSIRFNNMTQDAINLFIDWVGINTTLQTLYLMNTNLDDKSREKLTSAWQKNLISHRTDNFGFTLIRITVEMAEEGGDEDDD